MSKDEPISDHPAYLKMLADLRKPKTRTAPTAPSYTKSDVDKLWKVSAWNPENQSRRKPPEPR